MKTTEVKGSGRTKRKRRLLWAAFALLSLGAVVFFTRKNQFPPHPQFGPIYETLACDLNEARSDPIGALLRKVLPRRIIQSPRFPIRFKDQVKYMDLDGNQLEWSLGGTTTGWLYFWDVNTWPRTSRWEFAPCSETNLTNVITLPDRFVGASDTGLNAVFGTGASANAINVSEGQILFARRSDRTNQIFVLKLHEQQTARLIVHYCIVTLR